MSYNYLPIPPRAWSRVQSQCTYTIPGSTYSQSYIPLTNKTVSQAEADYQEKLLYKGNILQYKNNSARLTKKQRYTQLAKGLGPNRTKVFATQTDTYTNPNTTGLLRINSQKYPFPNQLVGKPNNISGPFQYNVPNPNGCPGTELEAGGNLICGTYVNQCTGKIIKASDPQVLQCYPTYCSDVPGIPELLCWSSKLNTWFPRQRLTMNNSGNKFPEGYKGFVNAVKTDAPVLTLVSSTTTTAIISWPNITNDCLPITGYNIYLNGKFYVSVLPYIINYTLINLTCNNSIYIIALSSNIESFPSNIVISNNIPSAPYITSTPSDTSITVNWVSILCAIDYTVYWNDGTNDSSGNTTDSSYKITDLSKETMYTIYVIANNSIGFSISSNIIQTTTETTVPGPPNNLTLKPANISIFAEWEEHIDTGGTDITSYSVYWNDGTNESSGNTTDVSYNITGLTNGTTYQVSVVAINAKGPGDPAQDSATPYIDLEPPTNLQATIDTTSIADTINLSWDLPKPLYDGTLLNIYGYITDSKPILYDTVSNTTTNYKVTNLIADTSYNFYVTSYFDGADSLHSNTASCSTQPIITSSSSSYEIITKTFVNKINYQIIFYANSNFTINSNAAISDPSYNIVVILIGGGGGGASCGNSINVGGGGGGGGGETLQIPIPINSVSTNTSFSITLGNGGLGGVQNNDYGSSGIDGSLSTFAYNSNTYTANPGLAGKNGTNNGNIYNNSGGQGGNGGLSDTNGGSGGAASGSGGMGTTIPYSNYKSIGGGGGGNGGNTGAGTYWYATAGGGGGGGVGYDISLNSIITDISLNSIGDTSTGGTGGGYGFSAFGVPGLMYGGKGGGVHFKGYNGKYGGGGGGAGVKVSIDNDDGTGGNGGNGLCVVTITYVIKNIIN